MDKPTYLDFDKSKCAWRPDVDYRSNPELYRVGKGEQGVFICELYKGDLGTGEGVILLLHIQNDSLPLK